MAELLRILSLSNALVESFRAYHLVKLLFESLQWTFSFMLVVICTSYFFIARQLGLLKTLSAFFNLVFS